MPIYEYVATAPAGCPTCARGFEVLQRLTDARLTHCPQCANAIHRIITAPQVVSGQGYALSEKHIAKHGFTQYRRVGKGQYEKTAGKGPSTISGE